MTAARLSLQNEVLRDLFTNELLCSRSLKLESVRLLLNSLRVCPPAAVSFIVNRLSNELLGRGRSLNLDSLQSFAVARRVGRRVSTLSIMDRFTKALLGAGRGLILDALQSLVTGGMGLLQAAVFVIVGRLTNEVFVRDCVRVVLNAGRWNRSVENVGWRYRSVDNAGRR